MDTERASQSRIADWRNFLMRIIHAIELNDSSFGSFKTTNGCPAVTDLRSVNILFGPNNSGKSRLLRFLFSKIVQQRPRVYCLSNSPMCRNDAMEYAVGKLHAQISNKKPMLLSSDCLASIAKKEMSASSLNAILFDNSQHPEVVEELRAKGASESWLIDSRVELAKTWQGSWLDSFNALYVPPLRTGRPVMGAEAIFDHIKESYFSEHDRIKQPNVVDGTQLYAQVKSMLLGTLPQRKKVRIFENFLAEHFFDGSEVSLSPRENSKELYVRISPEKVLPFSQLGDGIQCIVAIFSAVFLGDNKNVFLFIEEPELSIHPGLQRRMIECLTRLDTLNEGCNHQVFITTHSNHLLDISVDQDELALYKVFKEAHRITGKHDPDTIELDVETVVSKIPSGDRHILDLLGVQPSSVFLANCSIWVEGPTDRQYIRHLLEIWQRENRSDGRRWLEDRDYAFVLYGGSLLAQWSVVSGESQLGSLCASPFVIADGDISKHVERVTKIKSNLGDKFVILPCREIENAVPQSAVVSMVSAKMKVDPGCVRAIDSERYLADGMGDNMDALVSSIQGAVPMKWRDHDGGLVSDWKKRVISCGCESVRALSDLDPKISKVVHQIAEFVSSKNR